MSNEYFSKKFNKFRISILACIVFFLLSLLVIAFYRIQIQEHDKWLAVAKTQHQTVVKEPFKRGVFFSNTSLQKGCTEDKLAFVMDILHYHLYIDPFLFPEELKQPTASQLMQRLSQSHNLSEKDLLTQFAKKSRSRRIGMWLTENEKKQIENWWKGFSKRHKIAVNALYFIKDYKRSYPFGKMLGQLLHTVREDKDVYTGSAIPTGGLEWIFNPVLQGTEGKRLLQRSPKYQLDTDTWIQRPQDGSDVYLTVNHMLQAIAEEELEKGIKKVQAKSGWALMLDPCNGEILAIAQYPTFNPEHYRDYYNDPELLPYTKNRIVEDCIEPGSTMKPVALAIALKANQEVQFRGEKPLFYPEEKVRCDQVFFPGRKEPILDVRQHKYLNMYMAVQKSSNVYQAKIVRQVIDAMGDAWYRSQLENIFGLGQKSCLDFPAESLGLLPRIGKLHPNGTYEWSAPTPYALAMGYNLLVNPLQMARALCVIANGGYLVHPTIWKKIVCKDGRIISNTANSVKRRVLEENIVSELKKAMKFVTKTGGSGYLADIPGFTEAGKTSTTEKIINGAYSKTKHFSSFIGFCPVKNPRILLYIGIDEPAKMFVPGLGTTHFGGKCAAPIFKEIAKQSLEYLGEMPDDPHGYSKKDPRFNATDADWLTEIKELAETYKKWNE